ncbi:helix-turn-helix domain-containing protein [Streptomyces catenulae]|uniref:AraC family transcriptional regulator n=1 Tax=Streptomyces catenulae TaxID=66875 RepID=A0ABV2YSD7_9ACTN|nr:AraC family transcriptional regulator [Streptomyces catenulae]
MRRNGQVAGRAAGGIAEVAFPVTPGGPPGVEVTDPAGLAALTGRWGVAAGAPLRPGFHLLVTVGSGELHCSVDLTPCTVAAGGWLWVRPGQVLTFASDPAAARGTVVLFQPGFLDAATAGAAQVERRAWRLPLTPAEPAAGQLRATLEMLEGEYRRLTDLPLEVHVEVVRHLLAVLVLRLSQLPGGVRRERAGGEVFDRFRRAVERDFTRSHRVEDYARALGYSVRTLTRATDAATGCGAKRFLDDRILLEAKRLLVHSDLPSAAIGERLGFPGAALFTRFFRLRAGATPVAFRERARGTAG